MQSWAVLGGPSFGGPIRLSMSNSHLVGPRGFHFNAANRLHWARYPSEDFLRWGGCEEGKNRPTVCGLSTSWKKHRRTYKIPIRIQKDNDQQDNHNTWWWHWISTFIYREDYRVRHVGFLEGALILVTALFPSPISDVFWKVPIVGGDLSELCSDVLE